MQAVRHGHHDETLKALKYFDPNAFQKFDGYLCGQTAISSLVGKYRQSLGLDFMISQEGLLDLQMKHLKPKMKIKSKNKPKM